MMGLSIFYEQNASSLIFLIKELILKLKGTI